MVGHVTIGFIQQIIFTLARDERNAVIADHARNIIRMDPGGIDDIRRLDCAAGRLHGKSVRRFFYGCHRTVADKVHTVLYGIFRRGDRQLIRAHDPRRFRKQCTDDFPAYMGFKFEHRRLVQNRQSGHTVFQPALIQRVHVLHFLVGKREYQRAVVAVRHMQRLAKLRHQFGAAYIELCFQRTICRVKPAVDNGAVCLGRPHGDVVALFQKCNTQIRARKLTRDQRADYACADYGNVILHTVSPHIII